MIVTPVVLEIPLCADDEKRHVFCESIQTIKIDISPVHDIESTSLGDNLIEDAGIVNFLVSDSDESGNIAPQIQQGVKLYSSFALSIPCPWKERKTEVDHYGVKYIGSLVQLHPKVLPGIEFSGSFDQYMGKIRIDAPVAFLVGVGQSAAGDLAADTGMIEFGLHCAKACFDVSQAFSIGKLSKCQEILSRLRADLFHVELQNVII